MKRVSATQARRDWFRLLDEVASGEVVVIERKGRRIVLRREEREGDEAEERPDYSSLLRVPDEERADRWGWDWSREEGVTLREEPADEASSGNGSAGKGSPGDEGSG